MEGLGDRCFRKAMASLGGFDEAVTEFIRVPQNAHVKSLASVYESTETAPIPLAAQLMGSNPELMAAMAEEIERRGAPRIDINCGCPSNTVTGKGAGSSLLKDPNLLHDLVKVVVKAVSVPVTVKMRSGYEDTSLFKENVKAAEESGISFLTVHPRTKVDGYGPPAKWELIAEAKSTVKIPVVGNGDILNVEDALRMLAVTGCDALMIGRGAVINPFLFSQIRSHFSKKVYVAKWQDLFDYLQTFVASIPPDMPERNKISKLKQLFGFLFKGNDTLLGLRGAMLTSGYKDMNSFLQFSLSLLQEGWR
ncbi:MAG: tRNA-dihydrouridine synthase family protein [Chlamydiae bacterium]|nr:tRNA-dihydrouridine synthase family protein [Chlamydiota bacterium]